MSEKLNLKHASVPGDTTLYFQSRNFMYYFISFFIHQSTPTNPSTGMELMLVLYKSFPTYFFWGFASINSLYSFFSKILLLKKPRVQTCTHTLTSDTSQKLLEPKSRVYNYRAKYLTFRLQVGQWCRVSA